MVKYNSSQWSKIEITEYTAEWVTNYKLFKDQFQKIKNYKFSS
jgi:hypothetical protein